MGFSFNPLLWFVCKLCKDTFPSPEELKSHKLKTHLGDCLKIKCIIFEEKLLDYEWAPEDGYNENGNNIHKNQENQDRCQYPIVNNKTFVQKKDSIDNVSKKAPYGSSPRKKRCFFNPSVSLTQLTQSELNIALNVNTNRKFNETENYPMQKAFLPPDEIKIEDGYENDPDEPEPEDLKLVSKNSQESSSILKELLLKPISNSDGATKSSKKLLAVETTSNSNSNPNAIDDIDISDKVENAAISLDVPEFLENREYIVASVEKNVDGSGQVKFASTVIPTSAQEFAFLKQQKLYPTMLFSDDPNFDIDNYLKQSNQRQHQPSIVPVTVPAPAAAPEPVRIDPCPQRQLSNFEVNKKSPSTDADAHADAHADANADVDGQRNQLVSKAAKPILYSLLVKKVTNKSLVSAQIRPKQGDKPAKPSNEFTYYICSICNKIFTLPSELNKHKQVHDNFHCKFAHCTRTFPTEERQYEHAKKCVWK